VLFIAILFAVAGVVGFLAHFFLTKAEDQLAASQFESIAERALVNSRQIALRKRHATLSMALMAGNHLPNASQWPNIIIPGFERIATNLLATSSGREIGLAPFVTPSQLPSFEQHAYDFYQNSRKPQPFPNGTAVSWFGNGVFGYNDSVIINTPSSRYRETSGSTQYDSRYPILAPILHHNEGPHQSLMLNLHFEKTRGELIDSIIDCSGESQRVGKILECGGITDFLSLTSQQQETGPSAVLMEPIFPAYGNVATGLVAASIVWDEIFEDVFNDEVRGIDCVLETDTGGFTYTIWDGKVLFDGKGDLHKQKYEDFVRSISLTGGGVFSNASASYTLYMYPTQDFFDVYHTDNPMVATIGAVCTILLTSAAFLVYDLFVRRDIESKKALLSAKRAFVRFVSHEVRTPLNSVVMGLTLLQEDIANHLGFKNTNELCQELEQNNASNNLEGSTPKKESLQFFSLSKEIHENALRSVDVLNDLLNYDKIEMGNLKLELVAIPIQSLIEATVDEFRVPASQKKLTLFIDFSRINGQLHKMSGDVPGCSCPASSTGLRTIGDDIRISQVVRNLISNAIKFTPEGGSIKVRADLSEPSPAETTTTHRFILKRGEEISAPFCGSLRLMVSDSGTGMTKEQVEKVFGDGVQFNANDLQKGNGTGLGLHIAKGIMELHNGSLTASSKGLKKGTTFTMTIPLYHLPETENNGIDEETPDPSLSEQEYETGPLRVLVVDDAPMNRKLLIRLLQKQGHDCEEADDGDIAVEMVRKTMACGTSADEEVVIAPLYDTILLDNEMPNLSGPEAARHIRAMGCDVFIVGVTGNLLPDDVTIFKKSGANAILAKPFKMSALEDLWVEFGIRERMKEGTLSR